jgi:hypothetical protein
VAVLAAASGSSPTAPAVVVAGFSPSPPGVPDPVGMNWPAAISFEPCFVPDLPNAGNFIQVPDRTEYGHDVYTTTGTAGPLVSLQITQDRPIGGIWCSCYYDGTTWRFDLWFNGMLMLYWRSATFAYADPGAIPMWDFADNPGVYPDESWNPAEANAFTMQMTDVGCVLVPTYTPDLGTAPLLLHGDVEGRPFFASGDSLFCAGGSWQSWDVALLWTNDPARWQFGELGSGPTWYFNHNTASPPIGLANEENSSNATGNIRLTLTPPTEPHRVVATYSPSAPTAPSAVKAAYSPSAPTAPSEVKAAYSPSAPTAPSEVKAAYSPSAPTAPTGIV